MRLHDRAKSYLNAKGLTTEDATRVVGSFLAIKYCVLALTFPFCHRFQHIRSLLKPVRVSYLKRKKQISDVARRRLSAVAQGAGEGWRAKAGRKTLEYMDKLAEAAARREVWRSTANFLGIEPKAFAMTVA